MALKIARIVDFCGKSSGLADFENAVDRGSAVIFDADSRLCLSYVRILSPKRNLGYRSFFSLSLSLTWFNKIVIVVVKKKSRYVNEFIQIISFPKEVH